MQKFDPINVIVLIILIVAGVVLQITEVEWAGDSAQNNTNSGHLILKGWPYLAYMSVPVGNPYLFNEVRSNARLLSINILITSGMVIVCYFGWMNFVRPKLPKISMFDLLALSVGIAVAFALLFGAASKLLTTDVGMGFWVLEIAMTQRPVAQQAIVAILITISVYTVTVAASRLLRSIRVFRS